MTIKTINKFGILLILCGFSIIGCSSHSPIQALLDKRVALANGIDFDTAKVVALNPETGEEIPACIPHGDIQREAPKSKNEKDGATGEIPKCQVELVLDDKNPDLRAALELSKKPIKGEIKKNGNLKSARFVITVTTLYEGSTCNVVYSGGEQIENCTEAPPRRRP